jgi:hypothetical protein
MRGDTLSQEDVLKPRASSVRSKAALWLVVPIICALVAVRSFNLGADIPPDHIPLERDRGLYVDEGYKTLSARNLFLFGQVQWHSNDDYRGWWKNSPMTQAAFYLAFLGFGQSIESARVVSLFWFALLLAAYGISFRGESPGLVWVGGLLLLGVQHVLWVFSRVALFEIAAIALLFGGLLLARSSGSQWRIAGAVVFLGIVATFGIKQNSALFVIPAVFGILASIAVIYWTERKFLVVCALAAFVLFVPVVWVKAGFALPLALTGAVSKVDLFPVTAIIERFVAHPILKTDPFLMILFYTCALGLVLHRPGGFVGNSYRSAIFSVAVLGMGMLALMGNVPLRYCIIILPAYILLIPEWWMEQSRPPGDGQATISWGRLANSVAMLMLTLLLFSCIFLIGSLGGGLSPLRQPGGAAVMVMLTLAIGLAIPLWRFRAVLLSEPILRRVTHLGLAAFGLFNLFKIGEYALQPAWERRAIAEHLVAAVPAGSVIAGDWAPLFTLGTDLRAVYMNSRFNQPEGIGQLQPSHFLYCETEFPAGDDGAKVMELIMKTDGVLIGPPVFEGEYTGLKMVLYPLGFKPAENFANASQ